ncbi:MAG: IclR family transcriptional regulator, partial [Brachybacterium sp.]|nr:IclR family transcriptional regulator [Brachybacterium sp.]
LVSLVIHADQPITFTDLVARTELSKSTVSRLLGSLERNGLIERDDEGGYRGGPLFAHYASRFDRVEALLSAAQPGMERLAESTGETVHIGVPRGASVAHVAQIDSSYILGSANWAEADVPPHCSALGKVLMAHGAIPLPRPPLAQPTAHSIETVEALQRDLEQVRKSGFALAQEELEDGLDAVAAPIHGSQGQVLAALGVSAPSFRFPGTHEEVGAALITEARRISSLMAHAVSPRAL